LHKLGRLGKTILVSTHVMDEVYECDKAALLYNGRLVEYDRVENLLGKTQNGKLEELFFIAAEAKGGEAV
jgi:ABC-2 type transport system ATP-binding protein